jgi:predicted amino acid racemase
VVPVDYEIRITGRLSDSVCGAFEDFTAAVKPAETIMRGEVRDQSELHGLLEQIQSLGLELIEVRRID